MPKKGKKFTQAKEKVDVLKKYPLAEAIALVKEVSYSSFVGSLELHVKTNADPKYNDQMLRGTIGLPHGTGRSVRIAAFASPEKQDEMRKAGADIVGQEDLIASIEKGDIDFDILVTSADMMRNLARVAKVLGPKGLMPSPKAGTVSNDLAKTIDELKKGRVEYKLDKTGNVHVMVGKLDFTNEQLTENVSVLLKALSDNKPSGIKGRLTKKIVLAPTMGPGVQVDWAE